METIPPDEDEDRTRICARCGSRPRWSKHWSCTRCVVCAGRQVKRLILSRKWDEPRRPKRAGAWYERRKRESRARYALLKEHGAGYALARNACQSEPAFRRAAEAIGAPTLPWRIEEEETDGTGRY